jgi:hypothetical protein
VSQENVQLVLGVQFAPDDDLVQLVKDDSAWAAFAEAISPMFHADCEIVFLGGPEGEVNYTGIDGLRTYLRDWLVPWVTYRAEVEEAIDCGDRVLLLLREFGHLPGGTQGVAISGEEIYSDRPSALEAVGLEE